MRVKQVHGNVVRVLPRASGHRDAANERPEGDALISNDAGLILAVLVADCVPILMADHKSGAAAAVHAGWRGTCARVAPAAVDLMRREFGTLPSDLTVAIGPSIGPDEYEVGEPLMEAFINGGHAQNDVHRWFSRDRAKPHLDLWSANRDQLTAAGVDPARIHSCGLSTYRHPLVFTSYRREADAAGRMAGMIEVPRSY